jgi:hypothetical protein
LLGEYWDNIWFSETPDTVKTDQAVDFTWTDTQLLTQYAGDYVSARWTGIVAVPTTEEFTFYVYGDDGVRVYLD